MMCHIFKGLRLKGGGGTSFLTKRDMASALIHYWPN